MYQLGHTLCMHWHIQVTWCPQAAWNSPFHPAKKFQTIWFWVKQLGRLAEPGIRHGALWQVAGSLSAVSYGACRQFFIHCGGSRALEQMGTCKKGQNNVFPFPSFLVRRGVLKGSLCYYLCVVFLRAWSVTSCFWFGGCLGRTKNVLFLWAVWELEANAVGTGIWQDICRERWPRRLLLMSPIFFKLIYQNFGSVSWALSEPPHCRSGQGGLEGYLLVQCFIWLREAKSSLPMPLGYAHIRKFLIAFLLYPSFATCMGVEESSWSCLSVWAYRPSSCNPIQSLAEDNPSWNRH